MTRKAMYSKVKSMGLAEEIKKVFGKNFTNVSNIDLECFINKATIKCSNSSKTVKKAAPDFKTVVVRIVSTLQGNKLIDKKDAEFIMQGL